MTYILYNELSSQACKNQDFYLFFGNYDKLSPDLFVTARSNLNIISTAKEIVNNKLLRNMLKAMPFNFYKNEM